MRFSTLLVAASLIAINCLGYFVFPGHSYLGSDTQIYLPMLERIWDPSLLGKDLIAVNPHVSYTIYDELAVFTRTVTGMGFDRVLPAIHFLFRLAGIYGIFLIFKAWAFHSIPSLFGTAIFALGSFVHGPSVMIWELEPVPRSMALPLLWLAIGWIANDRPRLGAAAAGLALLIHAPTVWPVWLMIALLVLFPPVSAVWNRNRWIVAAILIASLVLLFVLSRLQPGEREKQQFFLHLDANLESLQRLRASYNWIELWIALWWKKYLLLFVVSLYSASKLKVLAPPVLRRFHIGLTLIGAASLMLSYLTLEAGKWAIGSQLQFGRALLFVMAWAVLGATAAAIRATQKRQVLSALAWFFLAYAVPTHAQTLEMYLPWSASGPMAKKVALTLALALVAAATLRWVKGHLAVPALLALAAGPFWAIPYVTQAPPPPVLLTSELKNLATWARQTDEESVFHFPDAGKDLYPGAFRAESLRAIYVDWKSGGQVNFHKGLADEWWTRWSSTLAKPYIAQPLQSYELLGVDYIVLRSKNRLVGSNPAFENSAYLVYATH